MQIGSRTTVAH